jgi:hypothetical protein
MVNRYRRIATSFAELSLGELTALDQALPELAALSLTLSVGHQVGQSNSETGANSMYLLTKTILTKTEVTPTGLEPVLPA